ncbi:transketolase [Salininema proteolyticum]|uniref:Transketolase n=1 Tax=Salininema proteolyticum TaxID=1607685 RepID=A0ABV8TYR1_9ACTN
MRTVDFTTLKNFAGELQPDNRYVDDHYALDLHWTMYDRVLDITPATVDSPYRDRYFISKGHRATALYIVLARKGFIPFHWLESMYEPESPLGGHPDRLRIPGVEISSGSLGHGLPLALGSLAAMRAQGLTKPHMYVVIGDGELDEGSNHEAIAYAGLTGTAGLTAIVLDNDSASHGWGGDLPGRFTAHGWTAETVDTSDHDALARAALDHRADGPKVVVARYRA